MKFAVLVFVLSVLVFSFVPATAVSAPNDIEFELCAISYLTEFATSFMERRTQSLVSSTHEIEHLAISIDQNIVSFSDEIRVIQETSVVFSDEERIAADLNNTRSVLQQWGEAYTHFEKEMTLLSYEVDGNRLVIQIREFTRLYFARIHGGGPEYTAWAVVRKFVFENDGNVWNLLSQGLLNDVGIPPLNESTNAT